MRPVALVDTPMTFRPDNLQSAEAAGMLYDLCVRIQEIEITADFRAEPEKADAARLRKIAGACDRAAGQAN